MPETPETPEATAGEAPDATPSAPRLLRLIGVYNAEGTLRGELAYLVGRQLGRAHCALCDITHGRLTQRREWKTCRTQLPVPFDTFHRNDQPDDVRAFSANTTPVVVAQTTAGLVALLGPDELDACAASPEKLTAAIAVKLAEHGLSLHSPPEKRANTQ